MLEAEGNKVSAAPPLHPSLPPPPVHTLESPTRLIRPKLISSPKRQALSEPNKSPAVVAQPLKIDIPSEHSSSSSASLSSSPLSRRHHLLMTPSSNRYQRTRRFKDKLNLNNSVLSPFDVVNIASALPVSPNSAAAVNGDVVSSTTPTNGHASLKTVIRLPKSGSGGKKKSGSKQKRLDEECEDTEEEEHHHKEKKRKRIFSSVNPDQEAGGGDSSSSLRASTSPAAALPPSAAITAAAILATHDPYSESVFDLEQQSLDEEEPVVIVGPHSGSEASDKGIGRTRTPDSQTQENAILE